MIRGCNGDKAGRRAVVGGVMLLSRQCFFHFVSFFVSNGWWDVLAFVSFSFGVLSGVWGSRSGVGVGVLALGGCDREETEQVEVLRLGHGASLDPGPFGQRWCKVMFAIVVTSPLKKRNRIQRVNSCHFSALLLL